MRISARTRTIKEQASDPILGKGSADAIAATAAFLKEQKKVDALLPSYSGSVTAAFVKAAATPTQ
jgi:taurine transport system substrate-binding protein